MILGQAEERQPHKRRLGNLERWPPFYLEKFLQPVLLFNRGQPPPVSVSKRQACMSFDDLDRLCKKGGS